MRSAISLAALLFLLGCTSSEPPADVEEAAAAEAPEVAATGAPQAADAAPTPKAADAAQVAAAPAKAAQPPRPLSADGLNRGDIYFYVTTRPNEGVRYEVSVKTGYTYYSGSETEVKIGDSVFKLFTNEDWAFTDNAAEEDRLVNAMRAGSSMVVTGKSSRGNTTIDTYSLLGITAALARAAKECS